MSHWNYRIVLRDGCPGIYEAYYENDQVVSITSDPVEFEEDSMKDLAASMHRAMIAFDKPIIDYHTLKEVKRDLGG